MIITKNWTTETIPEYDILYVTRTSFFYVDSGSEVRSPTFCLASNIACFCVSISQMIHSATVDVPTIISTTLTVRM
jgi:hypothetical protein